MSVVKPLRGRQSESIDIFIGGYVLYHPHRQKPSFRWLFVDYSSNMIAWNEKRSGGRLSRLFRSGCHAPVSSLLRAESGRAGRPTSPDYPMGDDVVPSVFSLIFAPDERICTFQARSELERDMWLKGFQDLLNGVVNVHHIAHVSPLFQWTGSESVQDAFELGTKIGSGSFAEVFKGCHKATQFPLAIKIVNFTNRRSRSPSPSPEPQLTSPTPIKRRSKTPEPLFISDSQAPIEIEEQLLLRCRHPNIVTYFGSLRDSQGRLWILTELCDAGSILDLIQRIPVRLSECQISTVIRSTVLGLSYLHANNIIHNDVKCSNILLNANGNIKLADFGVSKQIDHETLNRKSRSAGTLLWMAPEVMEGTVNSKSSDIWSLGITAIELANDGTAPFSTETIVDALAILRSGDPRPTLPDRQPPYSLEFKEFVELCLQRDPTARSTAEQLLLHPFIQEANCEPLADIVNHLMRCQLNDQIRLVDAACSVKDNLKKCQDSRDKLRKSVASTATKSQRKPLFLEMFTSDKECIISPLR